MSVDIYIASKDQGQDLSYISRQTSHLVGEEKEATLGQTGLPGPSTADENTVLSWFSPSKQFIVDHF